MDANVLSFLGAIIVSIITTSVGLLSYRAAANKRKIDTAKVATDVTLLLLEPLKNRLKELENDNRKLQTENKILWHGISVLILQIKELSIVPLWIPEDDDVSELYPDN